MNHKRKRPKHQRAGCLTCGGKGAKDDRDSKKGQRHFSPSVWRKLQSDD